MEKFRIMTGVSVSTNEQGTGSTYLRAGTVVEVEEGWEVDMYERLVDAKLAEHDKVIDRAPETKETASTAGAEPQSKKARRRTARRKQ